MQSRFDKAAIRRGLNIFFGLSLASIATIFVITDLDRTWEALRSVELGFLAIAVGLGCLDWMGGGLRLVVLSRGLSERLRVRTGIRAAMANVAMGAMTPSQAGGGPAQLLEEFLITMHDAVSALDARLAGETPASLAHHLKSSRGPRGLCVAWDTSRRWADPDWSASGVG